MMDANKNIFVPRTYKLRYVYRIVFLSKVLSLTKYTVYIYIYIYTQGEPYVLKNVSYAGMPRSCISADICPLAVYIFLYIIF